MADTQQVHSVVEPLGPVPTPWPAPMRNRLGLAALIIGIVALVGALVPLVNYGAALVALVGIVLGIVGLCRKQRPKGAAIAGAVVSGVALIVSIVLAVVYSVAVATVTSDHVAGAGGPTTGIDAAPSEDAPAGGRPGTRGNPARLGSTVKVDSSAGTVDWEVTLGPATLDANDDVAAENEFVETAPEGFRYAMVPVTVVYRGTETGTPWAELSVDFVSADGTAHASSESFAVAPSPLTDVNGLAPGASGTGNVVVIVPSADVEKGTWVLTTMLGDRYFFTAE